MALRRWWRRLLGTLAGTGRDEDFTSEVESHLELAADDFRRSGMSAEEARRLAHVQLGGVQAVREHHHAQQRFVWMEHWIQDLRFSGRALCRRPQFSAFVVLAVALAFGVNAAVLAVAHTVLVQPLPYRDAARLVVISHVWPDRTFGISPEELQAWTDGLGGLEAVAAFSTRELRLEGVGAPRMVRAALVSPTFFEVLGRRDQGAGRAWPSSSAGVVVSSRLLAGQEALGRPVTIGGRPATIAGVVPPAFAFPGSDVDVWLPLPLAPDDPVETGFFQLVGRVHPTATVALVQAEADRVLLQTRGPDSSSTASVVLLEDAVAAPSTRLALYAALAAGGLVLFVGCANVAALFVGRAMGRRREFAARSALGAGRARLVRVVLAEAAVVVGLGAAVGAGLGWLALRGLPQAAAGGWIPRLNEIAMTGPVLLAVGALALMATLTCAAFPAWYVLRSDHRPFLRKDDHDQGAARVQGGLVVIQVALSVVLLVCGTLLARSVSVLLDEDHGFEMGEALAVRLVLSDTTLADAGAPEGAFLDQLLVRVAALPAVEVVGIGSALPPRTPPISIAIRLVTEERRETQFLKLASVSPDYQEALGVPLLAGRRFEARDAVAEDGAVLLSASAARFLFGNVNEAVGQLVPAMPPIAGPVQRPRVIGVVGDVKYDGLEAPAVGAVYVPWARRPMGTVFLVARTRGTPTQLVPAVRNLVQELAPTAVMAEALPLEDAVAGSIVERRARVLPAMGLGVLAMLVAVVGIVGTLSRMVAQRQHALAVRAALGATPGQLVTSILQRGVVLTGLAVLLGVAGARVAGAWLESLLYGVEPFDLPTVALVVAGVTCVSLLAAYVPARAAAAAQAVDALRAE